MSIENCSRYDYLKLTKSIADSMRLLSLTDDDYKIANIYATVRRMKRKGFYDDEALEIAAQMHETTIANVQEICAYMNEELDLSVLKNNLAPYNEGQFEELDEE